MIFCWFCGFPRIFSWRVIASSFFLWTKQVPISTTRIPLNGGTCECTQKCICIYAAWAIDRMADCSWRRPDSYCQYVVQAKYAGISLASSWPHPTLQQLILRETFQHKHKVYWAVNDQLLPMGSYGYYRSQVVYALPAWERRFLRSGVVAYPRVVLRNVDGQFQS